MRIRKLGLAGLILILLLTGCGRPAQEASASAESDAAEETQQAAEEEEENGSGVEMTSWRESVQKMFEDPYGDYKETGGEIAFLTDGSVEDGGYNEAIYNGVRMYALGAGTSFSFYHADPDAPESYRETVQRAVEDHAGLIVCAGDVFGEAVGALQETYPQTSFLLVDAVPHDGEREELPISENVHCVLSMRSRQGILRAIWLSGRDTERSVL